MTQYFFRLFDLTHQNPKIHETYSIGPIARFFDSMEEKRPEVSLYASIPSGYTDNDFQIATYGRCTFTHSVREAIDLIDLEAVKAKQSKV